MKREFYSNYKEEKCMTKHDHGLKEKVEGAIDKVKGEVK